MKVFIVFTSLLAITFASGWNQAHYPINIPIIRKTGVPLESPEIVHARQAHLSQVAAVKSLQGSGGAYYSNELGYAGAGLGLGYDAGYGGSAYGGGYGGGYGGYYGGYAKIGHDGQPIETPEVQILKSKHFAALAEAASRVGGGYGGYGYGGGYY